MNQPSKPNKTEPTIDDDMDFEMALNELESVVDSMESGDLKLEDSLASFQRGIALARLCQTRLDQAEQTVEALSDVNDPDSGESLPKMENEN